MSTTVDAPRLTRDQAAARLTELLTHEPQAEAALAQLLGYQRNAAGQTQTSVVHAALGVLAARQQAKRIPNTAGSKPGGWVRWDSAHEAVLANPQEIVWPYEGGYIIPFAQMGVDQNYQRPLTSFVNRIEKGFDPVLFQTLTLSDRGTRHRPWRYAIIDGQTRWVAASRIGIQSGPCTIFKRLTPEAEADIFWRLQKERRGMISWHRFRAQLGSGDKQSLAIKTMVEQTGYHLGEGTGQLKAVGALEALYKRDSFQLERALSDLREAWGARFIPEGTVIRGVHFFLRHYPLDKPASVPVDDERLVRRLKNTNPDELRSKAIAAKAIHSGSPERLMAIAIQSTYLSGGKAK